ncbi:hypothetical protein [Paenibacillus jilunlii]|nr:hypothetical protein [Paenibacillus jilunlii]
MGVMNRIMSFWGVQEEGETEGREQISRDAEEYEPAPDGTG